MYKQDLYKVLTDHIKPNILKKRNKKKNWEYGKKLRKSNCNKKKNRKNS